MKEMILIFCLFLIDFFRHKLGHDVTARIVEAINDKGTQARSGLKRKREGKQGPRRKLAPP
jgi:hypothetical protein